jgi:hypothetical protein
MKRRMLRVMAGVVPLIIVGIYFSRVDLSTLKSHRSSYSVMTDSGAPLESLFDGARAAGFTASLYRSAAWHRAGRGKCSSQRATGLFSTLLRLFKVPSVYAADCSADPCGGHYFSIYSRPCGQPCSDYDDPFAIQLGMDYNTGWHYTGLGICPANDGSGNCACQEGLCGS